MPFLRQNARRILGVVALGVTAIALVFWQMEWNPRVSHTASGPAGPSLGLTATTAVPTSTGTNPVDSPNVFSNATPLDDWWRSKLDRIYSLKDLNEQTAELQRLSNDIALKEIPGLLDSLRKDQGPLESEFRNLLFGRWVGHDPKAASAWVERTSEGAARQTALNRVGMIWAEKDRNAAADWARSLPDANDRNSALTGLAYQVSGKDPSSAALFISQLLPGQNRDELAAHVASLWTAESSAQALEWAEGLPDDETRQRAIAAIATTLSETDPLAAGTLAVKSLPSGKVQEDAVISVVQRWAQTDPLQAAAWVAGFHEGTLRDTAVEELVKLWADKDLEQTGLWLNSLDAGQIRDTAMGAYVGALAPAFPEVAAEWVNEIRDENLRFNEIERIAELWLASEPSAARNWLAGTSLPMARKVKLLETRAN